MIVGVGAAHFLYPPFPANVPHTGGVRQKDTVENQPDKNTRLRFPFIPTTARHSQPLSLPKITSPAHSLHTRCWTAAAAIANDEVTADSPNPSREPRDLERSSTVNLVKYITGEVTHLMKKQLELAKVRKKVCLKSDLFRIGGLAIAGVLGLCTLNLLLVSVVFSLASTVPGWLAGLMVSVTALFASGLITWIAWHKRVHSPIERTEHAGKDDGQWKRESTL